MVENTQKCANKRQSIIAASNLSMINENMAVNADMLNSWKEVALYLGRGVRTVQRWELDLGLPVRRPRGKSRSAVIALKPELDHWLVCTSRDTSINKLLEMGINKPPNQPSLKKPYVRSLRTEALHSNTALLVTRTKQAMEPSVDLCTQSQHLCEQMKRVLVNTAKLAPKKRVSLPDNNYPHSVAARANP